MRTWQNGVTPEGRRSPVELKEWRVEVQPKARKSVAREYKAKVEPKG